jgi:hypothetical protein
LLVRADSGSDGELDSAAKIEAALKKKKRLEIIINIAETICGVMSLDSEDFVVTAKNTVREFMVNFDKTPDVTDDKILVFLNENGKYMFCDNAHGVTEHYMVFARNNNYHNKLFGDFLDMLSTTIAPNVNFIVRRNPGENPETYLDTLLKEAGNMTYSQGVRDSYQSMADGVVRRYGAKTYHELSVVLSLSTTLTVSDDRKIENRSNLALGIIDVRMPQEREARIRELANKMCRYFNKPLYSFFRSSYPGKILVREFLTEFDQIEKATNEQILKFLNQNRAYLWCANTMGKEEHYMVFAVRNQYMDDLFDSFFSELTSDNTKLSPNLNVVVGHSLDGKPQTFLDFIKSLADNTALPKQTSHTYQLKLKEFRDMYKAKYYHELSSL